MSRSDCPKIVPSPIGGLSLTPRSQCIVAWPVVRFHSGDKTVPGRGTNGHATRENLFGGGGAVAERPGMGRRLLELRQRRPPGNCVRGRWIHDVVGPRLGPL